MTEGIVQRLFPNCPWKTELACALSGALAAGALCEKIANENQMGTISKVDSTPVTITREILRTFPDACFIAEEDMTALNESQLSAITRYIGEDVKPKALRKPKDGECFWTIDPIDGTKGYIRGDQYCVCAAMVGVEGDVLVSLLVCPRLPSSIGAEQRGCIFLAAKGFGSYEVSMDGCLSAKLPTLPPRDNLVGAKLAEGFESKHQDHSFSKLFLEASGCDPTSIRMDSQCKYGLVARGEAGIYMRRAFVRGYKEKIWDHAPGNLIVKEAGGCVTDHQGNPLVFKACDTFQAQGGLLTTLIKDTGAHSKLLNLLAQCHINSKQ